MMDWSWITTSLSSAFMVVVKSVGIYLALVLFTRVAGLRSFSKMSSFDFAVTVAFGSVLASAVLTKNPPLVQCIVALASLFLIQYSVSLIRTSSDAMASAIDNGPVLIMAGSNILHDNLKAVRMTENDLMSKLREANVTQWDQVRAVVMEATGDVSVLHADPEEPEIEWDLLTDVKGAEQMRTQQ